MARDYSKTDYTYLVNRNKSIKHRLAVRNSKLGKKLNHQIWNKGKKLSEEHKEKISKKSSGKRYNISTEFKKGHIPYSKDHPEVVLRGHNHPNWIKDRSKLKKYSGSNEKRSPMYKNWRKNVIDRDKHKCKISNEDCSGRLEVHHILGWTENPELRYEINNGITLCHFHHPRVRKEEKRLIPVFQELVSVSK